MFSACITYVLGIINFKVNTYDEHRNRESQTVKEMARIYVHYACSAILEMRPNRGLILKQPCIYIAKRCLTDLSEMSDSERLPEKTKSQTKSDAKSGAILCPLRKSCFLETSDFCCFGETRPGHVCLLIPVLSGTWGIFLKSVGPCYICS